MTPAPRFGRPKKIWLNGELVPPEEAKVSVFDHGLLYGDGVFEGIRCYDGLVFCLDEHLERMYAGAERIELKIPLTEVAFAEAICETIRANGFSNAYVRPVVTRGEGDLGLNPAACLRPTVFIIADGLTLYPEKYYKEGMDVIFCEARRNDPRAIPPTIKSLNYLNNIIARLEVNRRKAGEGIFLNGDGYITEGTADNIFVVRKGRLETPPVEIGALPGVTRRVVMELAARMGIEVAETRFQPDDLAKADECFLTGTGAEVVPVRSIEGKPIGKETPGPITKRLMEAFREETKTRGRRI